MRRVILESPYKGRDWKDTEENLRFARLCMRYLLLRGEAPFASHLLYTQEGVLNDKVPEERKLGIEGGFAWKPVGEKTVVGINRGVSVGMQTGIKKTIKSGHELEYFVLPNYPKAACPIILTITGASGVGKTTIIKRFLEMRPDAKLIKSFTTRSPRDSDLPGEYECNIPAEEMERLGPGFFRPFNIHGHSYGTLKKSVVEAFPYLEHKILIIVPEAVKAIRDYFSKYSVLLELMASFYVLSPGEEELRRRLSGRGEAEIQKRIEDCKKWDEEALVSDIPYIFLSNKETDHIGIEKAVKQMLVFF